MCYKYILDATLDFRADGLLFSPLSLDVTAIVYPQEHKALPTYEQS